MIIEKYQVSAVPVKRFADAGNSVIGYPIMDGDRCYIITGTAGASTRCTVGNCICSAVEVDPATVEPVRVKPIFKPATDIPNELYCPNCNYDLMGGVEENPEHDPPYCWECGQALDWSDPT